MDVYVCSGGRALQTPDGLLWTRVPGSDYRKWTPYLSGFDRVFLVMRAKRVGELEGEHFPMCAEGIQACPQPYYEGPASYLVKRPRILANLRTSVPNEAALVLRVPHALSSDLFSVLSAGRPFGAEVVGDPATMFGPGGMRIPFRNYVRKKVRRDLRSICRRASAVSYVTRFTLQKSYPAGEGAFQTYYSSIDLPAEALGEGACPDPPPPFLLFHAGSMSHRHKGQDILIRAAARLLREGWPIQLRLAGEGREQSKMEELTRELGVAERVTFLGRLPGAEAVRREIDVCHLFVLPSRSEGLPRVLIEAMARARPCIGSSVGGIVELLAAEDRIAEIAEGPLAAKIAEVLSDEERRRRMGRRNLARARDYTRDRLNRRRSLFYRHLREETRRWAAGGTARTGRMGGL